MCNHRNLLIDEYPKLVEAEWDYVRNADVGINVNIITSGSNIKAWWHCNICHGKYQMTVYHKTSGRGCPYCAGRKVLVGYNDLLTLCTDLINSEWDWIRNGKTRLEPDNLTVKSRIEAWWHCNTCDGSYLMSVSMKTSGRGCPFCAGKRILIGFNDLQSKHTALINDEWDWIENDKKGIKPDEVTSASNIKAWWHCSKCKGKYEMTISKKTIGHQGCPYCSGHRVLIGYNDLETKYPELIKEWDWARNNANNLQPDSITSGSTVKAWWRCSHDSSHSWYATISKRVSGQDCPKCSHRISKQEDEVADFIMTYLHANYANMKYTMFRSIKFKKVYELLHIDTDNALNDGLQAHLLKEIDIYIPELGFAIEYDGDYWHSDEVMMERCGLNNSEAHSIKQALCKQAGIALIFITEHDWLNDTDNVKNMLTGKLGRSASNVGIL